MHDDVDRQRQTEPRRLRRHRLLARECAVIACDAVGGLRLRILDRHLDVIEPVVGKRAQPRIREADTGGDQIGIQPGRVRRCRRSRRGRGATPVRRPTDGPAESPSAAASRNTRAQVSVSSSSFGASSASGFEQYGTAERTAMRQLGEQTQRRGQVPLPLAAGAGAVARSVTTSPADACRQASAASVATSVSIRSRGALKVAARSSTICVERRLTGAALQDFDRNRIRLEDALRRQQHPAALRLVMREPHTARQPRLGIGGISAAGEAGSVIVCSSGTKAPGGICPGAT